MLDFKLMFLLSSISSFNSFGRCLIFSVLAILPTPDSAVLRDRRMKNLVWYAKKGEADVFETASSRVCIKITCALIM